MNVLTLNVGSSTLKAALYQAEAGDEVPLWRATFEREPGADIDLGALRKDLADQPAPEVVGHRVVHGGVDHVLPELVDDGVVADLEALVELAPLHQPSCLEAIRRAREVWPELPHVACFDTAFHHSLDAAASTFPIAAELRGAPAIRRYGFHGLSYEYVVDQVGPEELGRAVLAHLGSGASVCAVQRGESVDTTMGLTPTGGLVMASRSGDLDPGLVIHLLRSTGWSVDELERLLEGQSGLRGLSRRSSDMRELLVLRRQRDPDATLAVEVFCRSVRRAIAGAASMLGGIDTLVFTGGIGHGSDGVRRDICAGLTFMGVALDDQANRMGVPVISTPRSAVVVRSIETDEGAMIARHSSRLLVTRGEVGI
jgi:acetate kinase